MRPPIYRSIARIGVRPEPAAIVGPRKRGSRRPHTDAKVAAVRRLIEQCVLTYTEIAARTGVAQASICRWTRDGGWKRPLFAPRATDTVPSARASARLKARTLAARLRAVAERAIRELEDSASVDLDKLGEALELLKMARLAERFLSNESFRNGQPSALGVDVIDFMNALKIEKALLAGFDWGARSADIVAALWPERVKALVAVSGYLIGNQEAGRMPLPPKAEFEWWYQFYFATERGRAGYEKYRNEFSKLIWQIASPKWSFDDATFARSAAAFDNPDHVDIVIHNYRWRLGLADGERKYDDLEKRLATGPTIGVPTITLESDANGAPHPEPSSYAKKFAGRYEHRHIEGGIGHNLPQEDPKAFVQAIMDVAQA